MITILLVNLNRAPTYEQNDLDYDTLLTNGENHRVGVDFDSIWSVKSDGISDIGSGTIALSSRFVVLNMHRGISWQLEGEIRRGDIVAACL